MHRFQAGLAMVTALLLTTGAAMAEVGCTPVDTRARILQSPAPGDLHPDWSDGSTIGLAWTLSPWDSVEAGGAWYIVGDLYSPDGGLVNEGVYVSDMEWDCDEG